MKNVALIMAGGKGSRFWPMSTEKVPKQFLNLTDPNYSMIQLTVNRIKDIIDYDDIYVVTNSNYKSIIESMLNELPKENIIYEPCGRNTAPCIGLATMLIKKKYGNANVLVLASDHMIKDEDLFRQNIKLAFDNCNNDIYTIGIVPTMPETGYGYIEVGNNYKDIIYDVVKFVEKPNLDKAKEYLSSGKFWWNSGMFIWNNDLMDKLLSEHTKDLYMSLNKIYDVIGTPSFYSVLATEFEKMESISIDYAIMEKVKNIKVIKGLFGWDDVGSWLSLERLNNKDENNNIIRGNVINIDANNCTVINDDTSNLIVNMGTNNIVIVKSKNKLLIIDKESIKDMKKVTEEIKKLENEEFL